MHLHSLSAARAVQWFTNNTAREWELTLRCPSSTIILMKMEDDEQHTLHVTLPYDRFLAEPFASLEIYFSQLMSLTLEEPDRVIRCTYGLTLPALRSFTICLDHGRERSRDWLAPTANVLSAPALQLLSVQYAEHHTVDRSRAMSIIRHVPSIVTTGEHRFQTLQLIGHGAAVLCNQALFAWSFCEEIKLEDIAPDSTQRATYVISPTRSRRVPV
ncbi:hypothetical protein EXIGLDRAFT_290471 [Exidia glandulosa HHB12029]|uniref:Uncharacterized protein n=1 Tax=Exidia glandulosa HHB12029 TaxID=1314781 RepID=A0A165DEQ6_EXIGL|nr:hypothetical protein EXIGLDRAFT_290471 [Exidia glandulosa HHB12029]